MFANDKYVQLVANLYRMCLLGKLCGRQYYWSLSDILEDALRDGLTREEFEKRCAFVEHKLNATPDSYIHKVRVYKKTIIPLEK